MIERCDNVGSYEGFASVYDSFMDNIPYEQWGEYLVKLLKQYGVEEGLILDMGCGTGNITQLLARADYDMIGIDNSEEMLSIAIEKKNVFAEEDKRSKILYLLQDMREMELYGTVSAVVSICDSMNYLLEEDDLLRVFRLVNNYLDKDGLFIFDLNTEYKYKYILGENIISENREDKSFIWENYYYESEKINEYDLTIYVKENTKENLYHRYEETHYQRAYSLEEVRALLEKAGLEYIAAYDAFSEQPPTEQSERIYIIAKEGYQENKKYMK